MDPVLVQFGEAIHGTVPPWLIPVFVAITRLGNVGVFLALFAIDYWFGDHERGAHAISVVIGGMALLVALKAFYAEPRPPENANVVPISGFSFPSGHAAGATIAYGVLAYDFEELGPRRLRFAAASLLIGLVAFSRIALGVHYVRDVVAGIVVGVAFLAATIVLTKHAPRSGFLIALGLAVVALVISDVSHDGVSVLGATLGAALAWETLDRGPNVDTLRERAVLLGGVLPVLAVVGYFSTRHYLSLPVVFALNGIVLAGLLTSPYLAEWV